MAVTPPASSKRLDDAVHDTLQSFDDYICLLCYNTEMRCGLVEGVNKGLWLPYKEIVQGESWDTTVESLLNELSIKSYTNQGIVQVLRIQPGLNRPFFTRVIFTVRVNESADRTTDEMGEQQGSLQWIAAEEIQRMAKVRPYPFMGVEPFELSKLLLQSRQVPVTCDFTEMNASTSLASQTGPAKSQIEQMLESSKFGQTEQDMVRFDFFKFARPSTYMNELTFQRYLSSLGWEVNSYLGDLFR